MNTPFWNDANAFEAHASNSWPAGALDTQFDESPLSWPNGQPQLLFHQSHLQQDVNQLPDFLLPYASKHTANRASGASLTEIQETPCDNIPVASTSRPSEEPSGNVTAKKRRTKLGCTFCKRSKKGCTLERPSCKRCLALNYECSYPEATVPNKIGPRLTAKKKQAQSKNSQLIEHTSWPPDPHDQSFTGWTTIHSPLSITDPIFDAFSSASPYSTPSVSYSAFQTSVSPRSVSPGPNSALLDLLREALVDATQADRLAGIYALSHWVAAHPSALQHIFVPLYLENPSYHVPFHRVFMSSQKSVLPAAQVFFDIDLPPETDQIISLQLALPRDDGLAQAEEEAWRDLHDTSRRLEDRICGILQVGSVAAYTTGALAYRKYWTAVREVMLTYQPLGTTVDYTQYALESSFCILGFFWSDVLESITAVRPHTFRYRLASDNPMQQAITGSLVELVMDNALLVALSEASSLSYEAHSSRLLPMQDPAPHIIERARTLAEHIRSVPATSCSTSLNSLLNVSQLASQELWRQCTWIQYHQGIFRRPADHPEIKAALSCMMQLFDVAALKLSASFRGPLALPIFLAASVALTQEDRKKCQRMMEELGSGKVWQEALQLILLVWSESDAKGFPVDFRDLVVEGRGRASFV